MNRVAYSWTFEFINVERDFNLQALLLQSICWRINERIAVKEENIPSRGDTDLNQRNIVHPMVCGVEGDKTIMNLVNG